MNKKRWMKTTATNNGASTSVTPVTPTRIFMSVSNAVRKDHDFTQYIYSPPAYFVRFCEDIPELTASQIRAKMTEFIEDRTGVTEYARTPIGVSNLTIKKAWGRQHELSQNTYWDDGTVYTSGTDFDAVCLYYVFETSTTHQGGAFDFAPVAQELLQGVYGEGEDVTVCLTHHNCSQYYGTSEVIKAEVIPQYLIGTTQTLAGGVDPINKFDGTTWQHFNLATANPFNYVGSQITSIDAYNATALSKLTPLKKYPILQSGSDNFRSSDNVSFHFVYMIIACQKGSNATRVKVF